MREATFMQTAPFFIKKAYMHRFGALRLSSSQGFLVEVERP